jgi:hypothetical protein
LTFVIDHRARVASDPRRRLAPLCQKSSLPCAHKCFLTDTLSLGLLVTITLFNYLFSTGYHIQFMMFHLINKSNYLDITCGCLCVLVQNMQFCVIYRETFVYFTLLPSMPLATTERSGLSSEVQHQPHSAPKKQ